MLALFELEMRLSVARYFVCSLVGRACQLEKSVEARPAALGGR